LEAILEVIHVMPRLARIELSRSLESHYFCGLKIQMTVLFVTEFHEPVLNLTDDLDINFSLSENFLLETGDDGHLRLFLESQKVNDSQVYEIKIPVIDGERYLTIDSTGVIDGLKIIPLNIGPLRFSPRNEQNLILKKQLKKNLYMFKSIRTFPLTGNKRSLKIEEEFGFAIGAHVWDSAIVLSNYLSSVALNNNNNEFGITVLELGAGCGLAGISMAKSHYLRKLFLTDRESLIPFLKRNVQLNFCSDSTIKDASSTSRETEKDNVVVMPLDWSQTSDLEAFYEVLRRGEAEEEGEQDVAGQKLDMILAADVLYDKDATASLFAVLRRLALPYVTVIYIAQKCRQHMNEVGNGCIHTSNTVRDTAIINEQRAELQLPGAPILSAPPQQTNIMSPSVRVQDIPDFKGDVVHRDADVLIWKLLYVPLDDCNKGV